MVISSSAATVTHGGDFRSLGVTTHLYEALRRLRILNESEWLWNDAICINQESNEEKNDQVARMRMIYSSAKRVYVWLGICSTNSFSKGFSINKILEVPMSMSFRWQERSSDLPSSLLP